MRYIKKKTLSKYTLKPLLTSVRFAQVQKERLELEYDISTKLFICNVLLSFYLCGLCKNLSCVWSLVDMGGRAGT